MFTIQYQVLKFMNSLSPLQIDLFDVGEMALLIPIMGILLPVFIVLIVFVYESKQKKYKYDALIEVSKNVKDSEEISNLLKSFKESKSNKDLRRTGLVTLFTGIGLAALGEFGLSLDILFGVGLLVMFIGLGQMIAGYVYPNQPDEITDVVESYEKK
jgi:hypothetical protein|tara:strand:+ start:232 stop:702 length:471 start_codon:yes stop_codon:yes gene_type:complete